MGTVSDTTEYWWGNSYVPKNKNRPPDYTEKKNAKQKAKMRKINKMKKKHPELSRKQISELLKQQQPSNK